ncbi:MAG: type II toxin-antitoxin system ParD family antitoxin [Aquamicrobium sp.]|uniref:type II toxin-antitoxin system ParD family antitoxin n=1 Tax=Aquamicrobium sp. TaxID=1872579 RepID=UPI00349EF607|nr:type II toxin-antitoxin system ParD family antitoxin [Aquamicrobium sp.]
MATMNVSLPEAMKAWVESQSRDGQYGNASDYIRDLIRKDRERKEAVAALQAAITEGIESGEAEPFDAAAFKLRMRERHVVR